MVSYDTMYSKYISSNMLRTYLKLNYFFDEVNLISDFNLNYSETERKFVRLNTTFRITDVPNIRTIEFGDVYSQDSYFNTVLRIGGIRVGTDYSLRPDIITYPLPDFAGETALPSSVDIFVDNAKVFSKELKPGPFEIRDIPVISPEGKMRVVIRDVLGREKVVEIPYITSLNLLKKGLSEYSFSAGFLRKNYLIKDFDYSKFVLSGMYKKGFTDRFTGEANLYLQGQDGLNTGFSAYYLLGKFGLLSPKIAFSYDKNNSSTGFQYGLEYGKSFKLLNIRLTAIKSDKNFFQPSSVVGKPKDYYNAFLGFNLFSFGSLSLSYVKRSYVDAEDNTNINISYSKNFFKRLSFILTYNIYKSDEKRETFRGAISMPLGSSHSGKFTYQDNKKQKYYSLRLSKNLAGKKGLGYDVSADRTDSYSRIFSRFNLSTEMADLFSHVSYTTGYNRDLSYRLGLRGDLIYMDGNFYIKRKSYDSFGIVKIEPPVKGAEITVNNRPIGKTDENGILFIPTLYAYNPNEIRINPESLDMKTYIEKNIYSFVPYKEHGYILKFKSKKMNSVRLRIEFEGEPPPAGTGFYVDGNKIGMLGFNGKAFIENITEGEHTIEIDYGYGKCSFKVNIDKSVINKVVPFIGKYKCVSPKDSIIVKEKEDSIKNNVQKKIAVKSHSSVKSEKTVIRKEIKVYNIDSEQFDELEEFLEFRESLEIGGN